MQPISLLLRHISTIVELTSADEEEIKTHFKLRNYRKKELLTQQNEPCRYESYVVKGAARSFFVDTTGDEHTLHFAVSDWWITELESFNNGTPSKYYIEALEDTQVLQISKVDLDALYESVPILNKFFRILHEHSYISQNRRILHSISMSGMDRYLQFLKDYPFFHDKIPQKYIASFLGITPVFLSQIRKKMAGS